jgi:cytochrome c peroxidase
MLRSIILLAITFTLPMFHAQQDEPDAEVQLGKKLFFDPILSRNKTLSCAGCHRPEFGFADTLALSKGEAGKSGRRNTPSILNLSDRPYFFFDGRAASLEEQILGPIQDSLEMNLPVSEAVRRLREDKDYLLLFNKVYRQAPDSANLGKAIAAYERTLETYPTAWDLHAKGKKQMSASAQRGHKIFNQKGKCFDCHFGPDFTGDEFRNIGLYNEKNLNDRGEQPLPGKKKMRASSRFPDFVT